MDMSDDDNRKYKDIGMITVKPHNELSTKNFLKALGRGFLAFGGILGLLVTLRAVGLLWF